MESASKRTEDNEIIPTADIDEERSYDDIIEIPNRRNQRTSLNVISILGLIARGIQNHREMKDLVKQFLNNNSTRFGNITRAINIAVKYPIQMKQLCLQ